MRGWLIDSYRAQNKVILWIKTQDDNIRIEWEWKSIIYVDETGKKFLKSHNYPLNLVEKKNFLGEAKKVYEVTIEDIMSFERIVASLEKSFSHRTMLYDADIAPEQTFLYHHRMSPGQMIEIIEQTDETNKSKEDKIFVYDHDSEIALTQCDMDFTMQNQTIMSINIDDHTIEGPEEDVLKKFVSIFNKLDPDIIIMDYAFSKLPLLDEKLAQHNIESPFHRWDKAPIKYKGNKTFYSYGKTILRDFAVRLKGRFIIDKSSVVGHECDVDAIMELCRLSGARFQQVASRSFGAVFQQSLIRLMYELDLLIPFKEKPVDIPISMLDMITGDSGGHRFDPKVGYHENVAEIDFTSMYPWIIYNKNISADTMLIKDAPLEKVPRLPMYISHAHKGLIPLAIKPLLDRRMEYKKNPTALNIRRAKGIKHVLVTAYGYARFREFKLGTASSHMAICSYAREILLEAEKLAEEKGFTIVHGIVDSLFLKKKGMTKEEVINFVKELELLFGMPISYEGMFRWIIFLPSINNYHRPLPSTYYGVLADDEIKVRGIEMRQKGKPLIVRYYQKRVIEEFARCSSKKEIVSKIPGCARKIREIILNIKEYEKELFVHRIILSKVDYKHNNVQKQIVNRLRLQGITPLPGQTIFYIMGRNGAILPEEYDGKPDIKYYEKMLERSLFNIIQPLGIRMNEFVSKERQMRITDFETKILSDINPIISDSENVVALAEEVVP